jgi:hypothetical protein
MNNLWQSLGTDGAIEWQSIWVDKKRNAGLSIQQPTSYASLIRSAPAIAFELADKLNSRALTALEKCTDSRLLESPIEASRLVFSDLQRSFANSINDVAREHALRLPHSTIRDIATIEIERVAMRLTTLSGALAPRMQQRGIECSRAEAAEQRAVRADKRDRIKMWISIVVPVATAIGSVVWAMFVDFTHGMYALFLSLLAGATAISHGRHSSL